MSEKQIAFEKATQMLVWGIANGVTFDILKSSDEVQEAVRLGYNLERVKEAWM